MQFAANQPSMPMPFERSQPAGAVGVAPGDCVLNQSQPVPLVSRAGSGASDDPLPFALDDPPPYDATALDPRLGAAEPRAAATSA